MGSQPRQGDEHPTYALLWSMTHLPKTVSGQPVDAAYAIFNKCLYGVQEDFKPCLYAKDMKQHSELLLKIVFGG